MTKWLVTLCYNGASSGAGRSLTMTVEMEDPYDAIQHVSHEAVRREMLRKNGVGSICIVSMHCTIAD